MQFLRDSPIFETYFLPFPLSRLSQFCFQLVPPLFRLIVSRPAAKKGKCTSMDKITRFLPGCIFASLRTHVQHTRPAAAVLLACRACVGVGAGAITVGESLSVCPSICARVAQSYSAKDKINTPAPPFPDRPSVLVPPTHSLLLARDAYNCFKIKSPRLHTQ